MNELSHNAVITGLCIPSILLFTSYINHPFSSYFHHFLFDCFMYSDQTIDLFMFPELLINLIMNIYMDSCRALHCRTQLLIGSPEEVSGVARKKKKMHRIQKAIEVLNFREFLLFGKVCASVAGTSDFLIHFNVLGI